MKKLFEILTHKREQIEFGLAQDEEITDFMKLRYKVYYNHNYFEKNEEGLDKDEYDREGTKYVVAKFQGRIIGGLRLIFGEYLPTETDCFKFEEPKEMIEISRKNRTEIGRLVVDRPVNNFFPRNLVMLGLFKAASLYAEEEGIEGGYSFIKMSLYKKMKIVGIPFREIDRFERIYNKEKLKRYFNDKNNPVIPIYYLISDFRNYANKLFGNKILFSETENGYKLKNSLLWSIFRRVS